MSRYEAALPVRVDGLATQNLNFSGIVTNVSSWLAVEIPSSLDLLHGSS